MRLGRFGWLGAVAATLLSLLFAPAMAQVQECRLPEQLPASHAEGPSDREPRRLLPIGGYTLALSWSPEYCHRRRDSPADAVQCGGGNRFGFTLHGLWPDGQGHDWPQYCRAATPIPAAVVRASLCSTPSAQLLQHEWAKHGTCMASDSARYFARSTALYRGLAFPDMAALSRAPATVRTLQTAFARANPGLRPEMIRVDLNRRGWLEELWLCLGTDLRPRTCPTVQGGADPERKVSIWRGGRTGRTDGAGAGMDGGDRGRAGSDRYRGGAKPDAD